MRYPQAPWTLKGFAFQTVHLIDLAKASPFVPPELEIVKATPSKTIGGVYLSQYSSGSNLQYNELIVVAALVKRGNQIGAWVSHIYVDNLESIAGGREIWGLPKEFAEFHWQTGEQGRVVVRQQDQVLCSLSANWRLSLWRQRIAFPSYSQLAENFLLFNAGADANFGLVGARLEVPDSSPFAKLIDSPPVLVVSADSLELVVNAPKAVGQKATSV
jgi:acetoacetate decarboxylase